MTRCFYSNTFIVFDVLWRCVWFTDTFSARLCFGKCTHARFYYSLVYRSLKFARLFAVVVVVVVRCLLLCAPCALRCFGQVCLCMATDSWCVVCTVLFKLHFTQHKIYIFIDSVFSLLFYFAVDIRIWLVILIYWYDLKQLWNAVVYAVDKGYGWSTDRIWNKCLRPFNFFVWLLCQSIQQFSYINAYNVCGDFQTNLNYYFLIIHLKSEFSER